MEIYTNASFAITVLVLCRDERKQKLSLQRQEKPVPRAV
jgi:hypothetical protein